jgi:hypothetical protein
LNNTQNQTEVNNFLQKEVLNHLKEEFDRELGYNSTPTEWFQTLMSSVKYYWLRELTSLMADIDILTELDFITELHASTARFEIEHLLFNQNEVEEESFPKKYQSILLVGSALLPAHSQLRTALQQLPKTTLNKEQSHAERKTWHEEHRFQSRKKRN